MRTRFATARVGLLLATLLASAGLSRGNDPALEKKAKAVLEAHCFRCHSHAANKSKGSLFVDSRSALLKGGESGPAIVSGQPEQSLLIKAIRHVSEDLKMPPKGLLPAEDIETLTAWVKAGAPLAELAAKQPIRTPGKITDEDRRYWAFVPVKRPPLPDVADAAWKANPIDRFIRHRLDKEGLQSAPAAEARALLRRLSFDVTGLPPTPDDLEAFLTGNSSVEKTIDRLLASPHYGERMAQMWLDVVHYAESDGFRLDSFRPHAWQYRDYVVRAFNADRPFDQFVREQIAGDELYPDSVDARIATGYLTHGIYEYNQRNSRGQWSDMLNEITDVTSEAILGLGMGCARCHDHKFDPILQKDYFALRAFFEGLLPSEDLPSVKSATKETYDRQLKIWLAKTATVRAQIEAVEKPERDKAEEGAVVKFPKDIQELLRKPADKRTPHEQQLALLAYRQLAYEFDRLDARIKGDAKTKLLELRKELAKFDADKPAPLPQCQSCRETGREAAPTTIPKKSNLPPIAPGFLTVLGDQAVRLTPPPHQESTGRRAALATWLTRPDHPLTARVIVNRVWQMHFGRGLVATANDFGVLGERPSHPELLDWLADEFVRDGWSLKKLHRLILTSRTYQQSSVIAADHPALKKDPENRLLARQTTRRLQAEQIRDAVLAATGKLDRTVGGPSVEFKEPRRSIYLKVLRNSKDPLLEVFDLPDAFNSTAQRNVTTTSTQALYLLNSPAMMSQGQTLADRVDKEASRDEEKIDIAFQFALGRAPQPRERAILLSFLDDQAKRVKPAKAAPAPLETGKLPFRDGKAVILTPGKSPIRLQAPDSPKLATDVFTLEAFVMLRTPFDDGTVRTIAAHWNGDVKSSGWALGVTGKKSSYKPQMLVLQLWGDSAKGKQTYEALFSGLQLQLNKPYYVAVAADLKDGSEKGITFFTKDLSNDEEPLQNYPIAHQVVKMPGSRGVFSLGGVVGKTERPWDGYLDDVRLSSAVLSPKQLLLTGEPLTATTLGLWRFEPAPGALHDASPHARHLTRSLPASLPPVDPRRAAWVDLCQVLLNANEFLYVD